MDFINLNTEYETLNQFSKQGVMTLTNLNSFFKTIHKYSDLFYLNSKKSNEMMFNELLKFDSKSTLSKNFFEFYRNYESFMSKMKNMMNKMEKELIEPINLFSKHLTSKYNECLTEYKTIAYSTFESKKMLEKSKHKYFDACKSAVEQEKIVLKKMDEQASDVEIESAHDNLIKLRLQAENYCQTYKSDLSRTNKHFEENEKKYFPVIDKMKNNEEARENFLKFHFEKFTMIIEEFSVGLLEMLNRMMNDVHEIKIEEDMKIVDEKLNFLYKSNERIPKEEFLNYEIYRRNLEKMLSGVNSIGSNNLSQSVSSFTTMTHDEETHSTTFNNNTVNYNSNKEKIDIEEEDEVNNFFMNLKNSTSEITIEDLTKLLNNLEDNIPFSKSFIDKLLIHYKGSLSVEISNYQNLHHFANILVTITKNTEVKKELFEMNFAIIYMAEKTCYKNPENIYNKIYLSKILSKNKIYTDRKFWVDLMNIKINSLIEQKIANELQKREKENSSSTGYLAHYGANDLASPRRGFMSIGSKMKNLFTTSIIKENKKIESSMIQSSLYEQIKASEASIVVKEYIVHFANFNFDVSEAIDIIVELSSVYNYDKDKVSYFISLMNSNYFTTKSKSLEPMITVNYSRSFMSKDLKFYNKLNDNLISIVASSMKYLPIKEYSNILQLNKNFYKKLSKVVYKNILFKYHNMDNKTRLKIWKSILNVYELQKGIKYRDILEEINSQEHTALLEPILLDVQRTSFDGKDVEIKRAAIINILKVIAFKKPSINYCQGMNYIAAFIYQLTNDEEEAFYIFYGIMNNTEYSDIFLDELFKLKRFFYVFDRLLFIYKPELSIYFKNNSIMVSYFLSPWFITLFTSAYQYVNHDTYPKNGWKAIVKAGLCLMTHYETNLLQLKYEDLLHFLINDILKYGYFQNSNYDYFVNISKNIKLESGLLSNLENEFYLEQKARESEEKRKEDQKKIAYEKEHSIKI